MTTYAHDLTLNQRFEIIAGWIDFREWKQRKEKQLVYVHAGREEYIESTAKRLGLNGDTVRLVLSEGIRA